MENDPGEVEEDFAATMQRQNAIFGYTHVGREDPAGWTHGGEKNG